MDWNMLHPSQQATVIFRRGGKIERQTMEFADRKKTKRILRQYVTETNGDRWQIVSVSTQTRPGLIAWNTISVELNKNSQTKHE